MPGEIISDADGGHVCKPPESQIGDTPPRGTMWMCDCGKVWIKTEYDYVDPIWRRPFPWEWLRVHRAKKAAMANRQRRQAEINYKQALEIVNNFHADMEV